MQEDDYSRAMVDNQARRSMGLKSKLTPMTKKEIERYEAHEAWREEQKDLPWYGRSPRYRENE